MGNGGGRAITAGFDPLRTTVTIRWPCWAERSSMLIEQTSATRRPSSPNRQARALSTAPLAAASAMEADSSMRSRPKVADSVDHLGTADMIGWGGLNEAVDHADAAETGYGGQPPGRWSLGLGLAPAWRGPKVPDGLAGFEHVQVGPGRTRQRSGADPLDSRPESKAKNPATTSWASSKTPRRAVSIVADDMTGPPFGSRPPIAPRTTAPVQPPDHTGYPAARPGLGPRRLCVPNIRSHLRVRWLVGTRGSALRGDPGVSRWRLHWCRGPARARRAGVGRGRGEAGAGCSGPGTR